MTHIAATASTKSELRWCLIATLVVIATYAYNKLYFVGVVMALSAGLVAFLLQIAYRRTGKEWLAFMPLLTVGLAAVTSGGGLLWGYPQTFALGFLAMHFLLFVFRRPLAYLIQRHDS